MAATVGVVTGWCVGPLMPIAGRWLARSSILQFLLQFSVIALALSSQFFPYSDAAPKRVVLQHRFVTAGILFVPLVIVFVGKISVVIACSSNLRVDWSLSFF